MEVQFEGKDSRRLEKMNDVDNDELDQLSFYYYDDVAGEVFQRLLEKFETPRGPFLTNSFYTVHFCQFCGKPINILGCAEKTARDWCEIYEVELLNEEKFKGYKMPLSEFLFEIELKDVYGDRTNIELLWMDKEKKNDASRKGSGND